MAYNFSKHHNFSDANWIIDIDATRDGELAIIDSVSGALIASVYGDENESMYRAMLISRAPALRRAAREALTAFHGLYRYAIGRPAAIARIVIPSLEVALYPFEDVAVSGPPQPWQPGNN